jgi:hypothetical protein
MTDIPKFDIIRTKVSIPPERLKPHKWEKILESKSNTTWNTYWCIYYEIVQWIECHPKHTWEKVVLAENCQAHRLSPELESWFLLRWS